MKFRILIITDNIKYWIEKIYSQMMLEEILNMENYVLLENEMFSIEISNKNPIRRVHHIIYDENKVNSESLEDMIKPLASLLPISPECQWIN